MTFALRMDDQLLLPDAVTLFETAETRAELALARMVEVMEAAQLSLAESPRYTSQLWRQLVTDQRT